MKLLSLFICLFFLFSCSKEIESKKIIKIDINAFEKVDDMPVLEIFSTVPLETNDNSLFGNLQSMSYFDEKFYLLDPFSSKSVLMFSKQGKYVNKTVYGRGPGEMTNPFAVSINTTENKILIWDQTLGTMFTYDSNLNFISRKTHDFIPFSNFEQLNDGSILTLSHYGMDYVYSLYSSVDYSLEKQFVEDIKYSHTLGVQNPISNKERTLFIAPFDYNVYKLEDKNIESELYFDFGKYKVSKEEVEKYNLSGIIEQVKNGRRVSGLSNLLESESYILFHVAFVKEYIIYAYNTKSGKVHRFNNYFEERKLPKCSIQGIIGNDTFYATVKPQDLMDFQKKTGKRLVDSEINLQQNPFVITFKLSEL